MIMFELTAQNIVQVTGLDTSLLTPAQWRVGLERFAETLQVLMSLSYSRERIEGRLALKTNSTEWNAAKARKGADPRRGHEWNRIQTILGRVRLFGISSVFNGTAVVTYLEGALQQLAPHAAAYAKSKVPGGRILSIAPAWLARAGQALRLMETRAIAERARRMRQNPQRNEPARPVRGRRVLTLAATAWSAVAKTAAKLNLLGRT